MARLFLTIMATMAILAVVHPANAQDILLDEVQSCSSNTDCTLVSQSCTRACGTLPVNTQHVQAYVDKRIQKCGAVQINELPVCNMHPPLNAVCINKRCTLDYAFEHHSHGGDYRNGGRQGPPQK